MKRDEVHFLSYITAISNVPSVIDHGILSHRRAAKLPHVDISMASVQDIRAQKRVPGTRGAVLHDYACLYLCARNPMMYKRQFEMLDGLCVLAVDPAVLDLDNVVIADHNAAASVAGFDRYPDGLEAVVKDLTFARYWTHDDLMETDRHRKRMCAEVLVPNQVDPEYIVGAFVGNAAAEVAFDDLCCGIECMIEGELFFH